MPDTDRLLTVSEAAERLRLNPETIRRWLRDGRLSGVWLGSDKAGWRISRARPRRLSPCPQNDEGAITMSDAMGRVHIYSTAA